MKRLCFATLLLTLLPGTAAHGQGTTEVLNRSHVGMVHVTDAGMGNSEAGVQLKFDFTDSPAEQTYFIEVSSLCCGLPGDPKKYEPVAGRWEPDTTESVGFFDRASGNRFYLRTAQTTGDATLIFDFFPSTPASGLKLPVMGDWDGDGLDSAGVYNRNKGKIHLKNSNTQSEPPVTIQYPGVAGQGSRPVAGDWDGDGMDGTAIFLPTPRILRFFDDPYGTAFTDYAIPATPGAGTLWPVAGDWNYDGKDFVGVYGEGNQTFYLLHTDQSAGWDVILPFPVSQPFAKPVAGSWDGESFRYEVPKTSLGQGARAFPQMIAAGDDHELYFSASSVPPGQINEALYFNLYSDSQSESLYSNDQWSLDPSPELLGHPDAAIALGTVFSAPTAQFKHPDGTFYEKLVVYVVEHTVPSDTAGWVCLSYADANNNWTTPLFATTSSSMTPEPCVDDGFVNNDILAEAVSGFRDGPSDLYFGVMNGDLGELAKGIGTPRTHTYLYKTTRTKPWYFALQDVGVDDGEFTSDGMNTPNTGGRWVHNYGVNLDFTIDPVTNAVYWARAYPYPFDIDGGIPCDNPQNCAEGFGQNPNRIQIYKKQLTGQPFGQQLAAFFDQPWELVTDVGAPKGWPSTVASVCGDSELIDPIQNGLPGVDINSVTFVKDGDGLIYRDSAGKRAVLLGGGAVKDRANGECDFGERSVFVWPIDDLLGNTPPVANADWFGTLYETPINIPFATLLANDTDADGDPLSVCGVTDPKYGSIEEFPDSVTYTPPAGCFGGLVNFGYTACDEHSSDAAPIWVWIGGIICPPPVK